MNPPRPRTGKNRTLPENLYPNGKYWRYRNPITGVVTSINKPMAEAIKLAKLANAKLARLMTDDGALLQLLTGEQAPTVKNLLERFETEWLPERKLADSTLKETRIKLERYRADLGARMVGQLDVLAMAKVKDGD